MHLQTAFVALVGLASAASLQQPHLRAARRSTELGTRQAGKGGGGGANKGQGQGQGGAQASKANQGNGQGGANQATPITVDPANIQTASAETGLIDGVDPAGESPSLTDTENFVNFCTGQTLTDGKQIKTGSCNPIAMGEVAPQAKTVSAVINNPKTNDDLQALTSFNMTATIANIQLGSFTNATSTYYSAPQKLNGGGEVIGHTHFVIQDMGANISPDKPVDGTIFAFFRGINDAGNGQGTVTTEITGGLPAGNYRACTMTSSSNHQPVLMAVAQRGAQDDCTRFTVGGGKGGGAGGAGNNAGGAANNAGGAANNAGAAAGGKGGAGNNAGGAGNNAGAAAGGKGGAANAGGAANNAGAAAGGKGGAANAGAAGGAAAGGKGGNAGKAGGAANAGGAGKNAGRGKSTSAAFFNTSSIITASSSSTLSPATLSSALATTVVDAASSSASTSASTSASAATLSASSIPAASTSSFSSKPGNGRSGSDRSNGSAKQGTSQTASGSTGQRGRGGGSKAASPAGSAAASSPSPAAAASSKGAASSGSNKNREGSRVPTA